MTTQQLRELFIDFFAQRGHRVLHPGAPLVLRDDPTSFFTSAGMQPYMAAFRGEEPPPAPTAVSIQKCTRTGDIEGVGYLNRYHTFFEMLGNFSFGDYFKKGAIEYAWEFVHDVLQLPEERLWFTVYTEDDEAEEIWHQHIGIPKERISRFGREDNWWPKARWEGPCGPCSEIFVDLGEDRGCPGGCEVGCDRCERYLELWNLVFQMYTEAEDGTLTPLPQPGIDTGMGLERLALVMQNKRYTAETDELWHILSRSLDEINQYRRQSYEYGQDDDTDVALRIIADHLRAAAFLMADGVVPSNEGPGYVLRRFIRRAYRFGQQAGAEGPFLYKALPAVREAMGQAYPELSPREDFSINILEQEEQRFAATLQQGIDLFDEMSADLQKRGQTVIPGDQAFTLYDTYGFPLDMTTELAAEQDMTVDEAGFQAAMQQQRERSRGEVVGLQQVGANLTEQWTIEGKAEFTGYEQESGEAVVLNLWVNKEKLHKAQQGQEVEILLDKTPFYAERGGQVGDTGAIRGPNGTVQISNTLPVRDSVLHVGTVTDGEISQGETVTAQVDIERRNAIKRHHTATHLLQAALRQSLGEHVSQSGSLVAPDRCRFDFTHHQAIDADTLRQVEEQVNEWIVADLPVVCEDGVPLEQARAEGIIALFGEKYGETVRVVRAGDVSAELCGGTHCAHTGEIGSFRITGESSIAAGIRRIEAVAGLAVLHRSQSLEDSLQQAARELNCPPEELPDRVKALQEQNADLQKQLRLARGMQAAANIDELIESAVEIGYVSLITYQIDDADPEMLGNLADQLIDKHPNSVVFLATPHGESAIFVCKVPDNLIEQGINAGEIIKAAAAAAGGGGGGQPHFAQGGGRASAIAEAFAAAHQAIAKCVGQEPE